MTRKRSSEKPDDPLEFARRGWLRQGRDVRHLGWIKLIEIPDVPTVRTNVVVYERVLARLVEVTRRLLTTYGARLNRHGA